MDWRRRHVSVSSPPVSSSHSVSSCARCAPSWNDTAAATSLLHTLLLPHKTGSGHACVPRCVCGTSWPLLLSQSGREIKTLAGVGIAMPVNRFVTVELSLALAINRKGKVFFAKSLKRTDFAVPHQKVVLWLGAEGLIFKFVLIPSSSLEI